MSQIKNNQDNKYEYKKLHNNIVVRQPLRSFNIVLPVVVIIMVIGVMCIYAQIQRKNTINNAEQVTNQIAEYVASNIASNMEYAKSSIKFVASSISQGMTSDTLVNPSETIGAISDNTPFGGIEYIRADGMNVMNIGEPFDASDREYYIEGIKGNTGIWNNYHPKTSQETLMNFFTPLVYDGEKVGVITGYIAATSQISKNFETKLFGQDIYGILVDENNMVICSTIESDYIKDQTLDMLMNQFGLTDEAKAKTCDVIAKATDKAAAYKDPAGDGRISVVKVAGTDYKAVILVPGTSFNKIILNNTKDAVVIIFIIGLILVMYAAYVILRNARIRREIAAQNAVLEEENRIFNDENKKAFDKISEISDINASANMGTWRIELVEGEEPRMFVDDTMKKLLGVEGIERTPEETYQAWYDNITPDALPSVLRSVGLMEQGKFDENTYLWMHPTKGERYVRCGGTAQEIPGGYSLRGYHYDVDDVVREDQAKLIMLQEALNTKNDYYTTLGTIGNVYNSMHVIDLVEDTATEFSAADKIKSLMDQRQGATVLMNRVMGTLTTEEYKDKALEFTDLTTLSERMKGKKIISATFIGNNLGWFRSSFITMEADKEGRPTKVIYTTRSIDEEKKYEEKLIRKAQTDELTGLLNRRAYEEDIYEHNDVPEEDNFISMSLDVNGLKVVNDTIGHVAGDELLVGASQCMKRSLGAYGRLYRTGGDEFIAILFCDEEKLKDILADFDETMANWSGKLVDSLTISYGWISKAEDPSLSVRQLAAIADQRMYEAKSEHYRKTGVDRRGQKDAHKALCDLYTKILKINISDDTYQIVNMDESEQTEAKGFSDKISEWLLAFGKNGQVHPDDLEEYLRKTDITYIRDYFAHGKTSLHVFYRRMYEEDYKQVMMEIIPANDYNQDNHSFYLYVKDIDR